MYATCPAHVILFDLIILIIFDEKHKFWNSSLFNFLQHLVTSFFLGLYIHLRTGVRDQAAHLHKTTGKIIVLF